MKKDFLLILLSLISITVFSQQVPRNYVLVEIATGTWCSYCPGASLGADDLIANGDPAAIIENHYNDTFETTDSWSRVKTYYNISTYPTANFDGSYDVVVGGSHTESMYTTYKPIVDDRIDIDADFTMSIFGSNDGDEYSTFVQVQNVGDYSGDNIKLRFTLTESEIYFPWQDQTELNFTNRLMVPDYNGIDLGDYDLSEPTDIEFDFTFNNTWDEQHCEIVVFIQDDDTQEVLQTNKIALIDLFLPIEVDFEADITTGCDGTTVNFTDLTVGEDSITYDWTFVGGTPETSTDQNPTITYNEGGFFSVKLVASNDNTTDSLTIANYISIFETPAQPDVPEGESQLCNGGLYDYTVSFIPFADEWEWELDPAEAGNLTVMDNEVSLAASADWVGDFTLKVRASNDCGTSDWSEEFEGSLSQGPAYYSLEGGGGYCIGGEGVEVSLNGSETEINYELFLNEETTEILIEGTGSAISFGMQTDTGYYAVQAHSESCTVEMLNQLQVYHLFPPDAPAKPEGEILVCNDQVSYYSTEGVEDANDYFWQLDPESAGEIEVDGLEASIDWYDDFTGSVNLTVTGINDCGEGLSSEVLEINVEDCTGIDDNIVIRNVILYPNPVKDELTFVYNTPINSNTTVLIFNHFGQLILEKEFQNQVGENRFNINMEEFESGIFIFTLLLDSELVSTKKFVKK